MNVSEQITNISLQFPKKTSVVSPIKNNKQYLSYTFFELEKRINQFCHKLEKIGVKKNDKVLLFIKPNIDFAAIIFAVFKIGAVGIFIDPGMGKEKLLRAIDESDANVLIGINKVHVLRRVFKKSFKKVKIFITNSKSNFFAKSLYNDLERMPTYFEHKKTDSSEMAAILYTSGGTGKPKGVIYSHSIFIEQTKKLQKMFNLTSKDVDLAGFPLFAMFTLSMGMKSVIPFMDPSKPAMANPSALVKNIIDHQVTFAAGSPAIWHRMLNMCIEANLKLDSIKSFVMFGAPIPYQTHQRFSKILPNGSTYTPYGATESLPVSNISGKEILKEFSDEEIIGKGICVGFPVEGVEVKINKIGSLKLEPVKVGEIGEIIVSSSTVTKSYYKLEKKTKESKINDEKLWHRMGDTGYLDEFGRIWFTGRVAHHFRIGFKDYFSIPMEQFFINLDGVEKAAFVQVKSDKTALIIQGDKKALVSIKDVIYKNNLKVDHILFHPKFPVDIRHNIKIDRKVLSLWAKGRI